MRKINYESHVVEYEGFEELNSDDFQLMEKAKQAAQDAYAPYSRFHVGAALLLGNGVIVTGNNQENAAYPSGLCAERVAMFAASAQYPGISFLRLAIYAYSETIKVDSPAAPCGACRQVMAEYEHKGRNPLVVTLAGESGKIIQFQSVDGLLPFMFTSNNLIR